MPERQVAEVIESPSVIELPGFINIGRINDDFYLPVVFENQYSESVGLGTGGYGTVIGLVMINGRHLAVKRFNQAFQTSKRAQRCFRELQLLKALDHENIVKMKFLYTTDKTMESLNSVSCRALCNKYFHSYLTTEYCGENLLHILLQETEENHFTLISIKKMVSELLRAIKYLNSAKIMHRDLKPDNLAIDANGKLTLLDFGLARVINENLQHTNDPGTAYFRAIETIEFDTTKDDINEKKKTYDEKG